MNIKVISKNVGLALLVSALFMFISMIVSVINGMDSAFGALSISFIITFVFGAFPFIFVKETPAVSIRDGYVIILVSWLLSFIFGMLPYVLWGGEFTLINAWFESVSGYTTTGSTILTDIEVLPKSLLFWRSSTHFIGGLGVVVFLLLILPNASPLMRDTPILTPVNEPGPAEQAKSSTSETVRCEFLSRLSTIGSSVSL